MNVEQLVLLTKQLLGYMDQIANTYENVKESKMKGDFFTEVKPFADSVKLVNDEWQLLARNWIKENQPKHLHESQIQSSYEQIEMLSVQAFYPDTSRTRFINTLQSVRFILNSLIDAIE